MSAEPDHLVVAAASLREGADHVERLLGGRPAGGGRHEGAGTHNLLLGLGAAAYLEVISVDPEAPEPDKPRLFGLDDPAIRARLAAGPVLLTWVARTSKLALLLARLQPEGAPFIRSMARGGLAWRLVEAPPGASASGIVPGLIEWDGEGAAGRLPDSGCRLEALGARHPDPAAVSESLLRRGLSGAMAVESGLEPRWHARIRRADGAIAVLCSG